MSPRWITAAERMPGPKDLPYIARQDHTKGTNWYFDETGMDGPAMLPFLWMALSTLPISADQVTEWGATAAVLAALPDADVEELPRTSEELREEVLQVIQRYPEMTICAIVGTLDMVKMDMWEALKNSGPSTDRPKKV